MFTCSTIQIRLLHSPDDARRPTPFRCRAARRCSSARARWSWASSTSPPIRSPTAACTSIAERAVDDGLRMVADGADILDVGGESTRPGAEPLPADEELRRVLPVVERLAAAASVPLSIDTYKAAVAREAVARGAAIVNDISGLQYDPELGAVAAETGAALVLMHNRGRSRDMYERAVYEDVVAEVARGAGGGDRRGRIAPACRARRSSSIPGWASRSAPSTATTCWRSSDRHRRARPADPLRRLAQVVPEGGARATVPPTSATGAPRRPWPPASCSAPTSCASTACRRWWTSSASPTASERLGRARVAP